MPLYFAYGSNMEVAAMASRCPRSRPLGPARLMRHRFLVTTDGYASVQRDPTGTVWGLLWDLRLADVSALDRYESLGTGLFVKITRPVLTGTGSRRAIVYVGRARRPGEPRPGYMENVVAAAAAAGLPEAYRRTLEAFLPRQRAAAAETPRVRPRFASPDDPRRA
jgi:hypothetical protein